MSRPVSLNHVSLSHLRTSSCDKVDQLAYLALLHKKNQSFAIIQKTAVLRDYEGQLRATEEIVKNGHGGIVET